MRNLITIIAIGTLCTMSAQIKGLEVIKTPSFDKNVSVAINVDSQQAQYVATNIESSLFRVGVNLISMEVANDHLSIKNNGNVGYTRFNQEIKVANKSINNSGSIYVITNISHNGITYFLPTMGNIKSFSARVVDLSQGGKVVAIINYDGKKQKDYGKKLFPIIFAELYK